MCATVCKHVLGINHVHMHACVWEGVNMYNSPLCESVVAFSAAATVQAVSN